MNFNKAKLKQSWAITETKSDFTFCKSNNGFILVFKFLDKLFFGGIKNNIVKIKKFSKI